MTFAKQRKSSGHEPKSLLRRSKVPPACSIKLRRALEAPFSFVQALHLDSPAQLLLGFMRQRPLKVQEPRFPSLTPHPPAIRLTLRLVTSRRLFSVGIRVAAPEGDHGLTALRDGVPGELAREDQAHGRLDVAGGQGRRAAVVEAMQVARLRSRAPSLGAGLARDPLEGILHAAHHDGHGLAAHVAHELR